jgi:hypothetical protein
MLELRPGSFGGRIVWPTCHFRRGFYQYPIAPSTKVSSQESRKDESTHMSHFMTRSLIGAITFAVIALTATAQTGSDQKKQAEEDRKWLASPEGKKAQQELAQINATSWLLVLREGENAALGQGATEFKIGFTAATLGGNPSDVCVFHEPAANNRKQLWCLSQQFPGVMHARGFRLRKGVFQVLDGGQNAIWSSTKTSPDVPTHLLVSNGRLVIVKVGAHPNAAATRVYWSSGEKLVK